jgi:CheY-like chemotaxis protein
MGGEIGATSTRGIGSAFWVELKSTPASQYRIESDITKTAPQTKIEQADRSIKTLLYVEDNPANLKLVQEIINFRADLHLLTAADANLGVELARAHQPGVILMDINLPGISGNEALLILRGDPRTAHIPVIALTANAMPRDIERSMAFGFFRYLTKPINIQEFLEALDLALEFARDRSSKNEEFL